MAASAYELLEAFVSISTRGIDRALANVRAFVNFVDSATSGIHQVNIDANISDATAQTNALLTGMQRTGAAASEVRRHLTLFVPALQPVVSQEERILALMRQQVTAIAAGQNAIKQQSFSMNELVSLLTKSAAAYIALREAKKFAFTGINEAINRESSVISLELLTGSAEKARDVLEDIHTLSRQTIFSFPELRESAQRMIAMGTGAEVVVDRLSRLAAIASVTGGNIRSIIQQYTQAQGLGILRAEDLNVLAENNFPVYQLLAKLTGQTIGQLRKLGSEGGLAFHLLDDAINLATQSGQQFGDVAERMSDTLKGRFESIEDSTRSIAGNIAQWSLFDFAKELDGLRLALTDIEDQTKAVENASKDAAATFDERISQAQNPRVVDALTFDLTRALRLFGIARTEEERLNEVIREGTVASREFAEAMKGTLEFRIANEPGFAAAHQAELDAKAAADALRFKEDNAKAIEQAIKAEEKLRESRQRSADSLRESLLTPVEEFEQKLLEAGDLLARNFIDQPVFDRLFDKAKNDVLEIERTFGKITSRRNAFQLGTKEAFTVQLQAGDEQRQQLNEQKRSVELSRRANDLLDNIRKGIDDIKNKPPTVVETETSELFN